MGVRRDLKLLERNTETVRETITDDDLGTPLNLTGLTIEFYIKPNDLIDDTAPGVVLLSTTTGEITITDGPAGICDVTVPAQPPGTYWRHLDVITDTDRKTAIYGPLIVVST